jgi:uncharacterized protein
MSSTTERVPELLLGETKAGGGPRAFLRAHPMLTYFALTFVISWGGVLLVFAVGPGGFPVTFEEFEPFIPYWGLALVAGPALAGPAVTALADGTAGLRVLLSRLSTWRVGARWYAVGLVGVPLAVMAVLLPLSLVSADFSPAIITTDDKAGLLMAGITAGLLAGVFEELGWTGFAVPRLRMDRGVVAAGLLLGVVWALWHFLPYAGESGTPAGALSLEAFLPPVVFFVTVLPVFRVMMTWVWDHTESLPVAMVMHASLSATTPFILAPQATGAALAGFYLTLAVVLWAVVAAVALTDRTRRSRPSPQQRAQASA